MTNEEIKLLEWAKRHKERVRAYDKAYHQRPEINEKRRAYQKAYHQKLRADAKAFREMQKS